MKAVGCLLEEPTLRFSDVGLRVLGMDPSHVAMVDFRLPAEYFDRYVCDEGESSPLRMTVNISELVRMLGGNTRLSRDEGLTVSYDAGGESVELTLRDKITRGKRVPALDPVDQEVPDTSVPYTSYARVLSETIRKFVLPDMGDVSEHICIQIGDAGVGHSGTGPEIVFSASGDRGSYRVAYVKHGDQVLELRFEEPTKATFTLHYLVEIFKGVKDVSEVVGIHLASDMPVKLDMEIPQGQLIYYLAPCVGM